MRTLRESFATCGIYHHISEILSKVQIFFDIRDYLRKKPIICCLITFGLPHISYFFFILSYFAKHYSETGRILKPKHRELQNLVTYPLSKRR